MFILTMQESTEIAVEALKLKSFENAGIARKEDFDTLSKTLTGMAQVIGKRIVSDVKLIATIKDKLASFQNFSFLEKQNYLLEEELSQNGVLKLAATVDCDKKKFIHNFFGILVAELLDALLHSEANNFEQVQDYEIDLIKKQDESILMSVEGVVDCSDDIVEQNQLEESAQLIFYDETVEIENLEKNNIKEAEATCEAIIANSDSSKLADAVIENTWTKLILVDQDAKVDAGNGLEEEININLELKEKIEDAVISGNEVPATEIYKKPSVEHLLNKLNELASAELGSIVEIDSKFGLKWPSGGGILVVKFESGNSIAEISVSESSTIESIADNVLAVL